MNRQCNVTIMYPELGSHLAQLNFVPTLLKVDSLQSKTKVVTTTKLRTNLLNVGKCRGFFFSAKRETEEKPVFYLLCGGWE